MKKIILFISTLLLSACQINSDESRRTKILRFVANHPVAAQAIGLENKDSVNITSNATRFSSRIGLDDEANGAGKGTQVNAVRHTLWQAAIAARFGTEIAEKIGNANENNSTVRESKTNYFSRFSADQSVDLRNNSIGREIGAANPDADMKTLTQQVLAVFQKDGLWMAKQVTERGRTYWRISRTKISRAEYQAALAKLKALDDDGFTKGEQRANAGAATANKAVF